MSIQHIQPSLICHKSPTEDRSHETSGNPGFRKLFEQAASNSTKSSTQTWGPLSKQELLQIVSAVRSQMNAHLIRAMSTDVEEDAGISLPLASGLLNPMVIREPSKSSPVKQDHEAFNRRVDLDPIINAAAGEYGVDPALIKGIIKVESNFNPNSTSPKGAMGLMQLMPGTARDLGVQNAYDPVENIRAGTCYLSKLLNRYEDNVTMALAAYNWGMGNLEKRPAQMPLETKKYIENVIRNYEQFRV